LSQTAYWDPTLKKYVIAVRRDFGGRKIGRCQTDNFSDWQKELTPATLQGGGCPVVFAADEWAGEYDDDKTDVYTNAWTPYPSIDNPAIHLYFPSFYYHFNEAPFGLANDGLLDVRLIVAPAYNQSHLNYTAAKNARSPFVALGPSACGANTPGVEGGWCSPSSGIEAQTAFDTSGIYMASGWAPSVDGTEVYLYSSGQPFSHGGYTPKTWGDNSGIRLLRLRKHGFVSVEAQQVRRHVALPNLTTVAAVVPTGCPPPATISIPIPARAAASGCGYQNPSGKCDNGWRNVSCTSMKECHAVDPSPNATCGTEIQCLGGYCQSTKKDGVLCFRNATTDNSSKTVATGGVQLRLNVETSVVGFVVTEVQQGGKAVEGMELDLSDQIKGSSVGAVASWSGGQLSSLYKLAGQTIQIAVAMNDAKLFSVELGCAATHDSSATKESSYSHLLKERLPAPVDDPAGLKTDVYI
jgi:hypothetical protein